MNKKGGVLLHNYLRAVGFSNVKRTVQTDTIVSDIIQSFDEREMVAHEEGYIYMELYKKYGENFGIAACGEFDENRKFTVEYYFPFFRGSNISTEESLSIEKRASNESYLGACDEPKIGISLIFAVQNTANYLQEIAKPEEPEVLSITLSALAKEGSILLPLKKDFDQIAKDKEISKKRSGLIRAARKGDESAMESLSVEDVDTNNIINKRARKEDIYTIVDTCFIPYGMECDQYQIIGEILSYKLVENKLTKELLYQMQIESNHVVLDICINALDLLGEPKVGRRFKGIIWLQGFINFS